MRKKLSNQLRSPRTLKCLILAGGAIFSSSVWGQIVQTSLNFATDPSWVGVKNFANGDSFGYSPNTNNNGVGTGEIGGFVQRADPNGGVAYYAANTGTIDTTDNFSFSGNVFETTAASGMYFGYFNDPNTSTFSSGGIPGNLFGMFFQKAGRAVDTELDGTTPQARTDTAINANATISISGSPTLSVSHSFSFTYTASTQTIVATLDSYSLTQNVGTYLSAQPGGTMSFNRLGILPVPLAGSTAGDNIFFDNLSFTYNNTIVAPPPPTAASWNVDSDGDWNVATNWMSAIPNGIDTVATFSTVTTAARVIYTDVPITVGTISLSSPNEYLITGAGSITLQSATTAGINVTQGSHEINIPLLVNSNAAITVSSGASLLIADPVTIASGKTLTESGSITFESTVAMGPSSEIALGVSLNGATNFSAPALSMGTGAKLDITNNSASLHSSSVADITSAVKSGYNGGAWNGSGITSSVAAADLSHRTGVGIGEDADGGAYAKFAYYGDVNLDGVVNTEDFNAMAAHYNESGQHWMAGDFNYDGVVNALDFDLLASNFGATNAVALGTLVPEPASLSLIGTFALLCTGRRRRG